MEGNFPKSESAHARRNNPTALRWDGRGQRGVVTASQSLARMRTKIHSIIAVCLRAAATSKNIVF